MTSPPEEIVADPSKGADDGLVCLSCDRDGRRREVEFKRASELREKMINS